MSSGLALTQRLAILIEKGIIESLSRDTFLSARSLNAHCSSFKAGEIGTMSQMKCVLYWQSFNYSDKGGPSMAKYGIFEIHCL